MPTTLEAPALTIETARFGRIEVDERVTLAFPEGLIGFEHCTRFAIVTLDDSNPISWLQSLDDGTIAFPIVDPWLFHGDYAPTISKDDLDDLDIGPNDERALLAIVTVPQGNPRDMTANLLAPVLVNPKTQRAKQTIVLDECYSTRHSVLPQSAARSARKAA